MKAEDIFLAVLNKPTAAQRQACLEDACGGDAGLRAQVEGLLHSHEEAGSFLDAPLFDSPPTTDGAAVSSTHLITPPHDIPLDFLAACEDPQALGRLGPYTVTEVIGRGGMGIVLKARDASLDRVVAIKVLAPELASNATARKRFLREAKTAAAVTHQHVVTIHAVGEDRLPYLVMECANGQSLQDKLDQQGPLELREVLRIGTQVAAGLAAAHAHGVIHRDIKPSNILLENGIERVRITDFGLARAVDDVAMTRTGEVAGTPQYMSPEQARGQSVDARSDLFSFGSVLYAMCTGRPPFRAETTIDAIRRVCDDTPRPIREINAEVPEWLTEIIDRLLAKSPEDRFQTAQEVAQLLGQHLAHVQDPGSTPFPRVIPPSPPRGEGPGVRGRASRRWVAAAMVLFAVLVGLGVTEATGVTHLVATVLRISTPEGTLVVEVDDPSVNDDDRRGRRPGHHRGPQEVRLRPGSYKDTAPSKESLATSDRFVEVGRLEGSAKDIQCLAYSHDGKWLFSGGGEKKLRQWEVATGKLVRIFPEADGASILRVAVLPGDRQLVTTGYHGAVRLWDIASGELVREFIGHTQSAQVRGLDVSADGALLLTSDWKGLVRLWDIATGEVQWETTAQPPGDVVFLPDDTFLYPDRNGLTVRRVSKGEEVAHLDQPSGIQSLAVARDGRQVAASKWNGDIYILELPGLNVQQVLKGHSLTSRSQTFLPDGTRLISACEDYTLRLWDIDRGIEVAKLTQATRCVNRLALAPEGRTVATGGGFYFDPVAKQTVRDGDYAIRLWRLPEVVAARTSRNAEPGAFVVLTGAGVEIRKFDILAEAVLGASDGDTIEIRGNGPFVTEPITLRNALTMRAGEGFQPTLQLDPRRAGPLLTTEGPLVLEGIEFLHQPGNDAPVTWSPTLKASGAVLQVANCRFFRKVNFVAPCVYCDRITRAEFRNSQFTQLGGTGSGISYACPPMGTLLVENCVNSATYPLTLNVDATKVQHVTIRLRNNTWAALNGIQLVLSGIPEPIPESHPADAPLVTMESAQNVFDFRELFMQVNDSEMIAAPPPTGTLTDACRRFLTWRDEGSLYPRQVRLGVEATKGWHRVVDGQAAWDRFWNSQPTAARSGTPKFQGGDVYALTRTEAQPLGPEAFRLREGSPGYRAGPDGKDLGADVDLVGPGAAYERWKQTPEYQQWLKDTGQTK